MGLSAKQEEDNRFQQIKKEVVDLIKMQAPTLESKVYCSFPCYCILYQILVNWLKCVVFSLMFNSYEFTMSPICSLRFF